MARVLWFLAVLAATPAPPPAITVRPAPGDAFAAVVSGSAPGEAAGAFVGSLALNGSDRWVAVKGQAERAGVRLQVSLTLRDADVPADWVDRFQPAALEYHLRGSVAGRDAVDWTGTVAWKDIAIEGDKDAVSGYVRLGNLELTRFSLLESEARAVVHVRNPFSFPLKIAGASYRLFADGREVGSGQAPGLILHPAQDNTLEFPIEVAHGDLLAAAGSALASGGEVEGRLAGELSVRLPGGDVPVPLDLSGRINLLSQ